MSKKQKKRLRKGIRTPTCDNNRSSLPLLRKDGNTSPWPGGYLYVHTIIMRKKETLYRMSLNRNVDS